MRQSDPSAEVVAPLLLELARVFRARQFYPSTHPVFRETLDKATSLWREAAERFGTLSVDLRQGLFALPSGAPVQGPGIDELAQALVERRGRRLSVRRGVEARDLEALVDALSETTESGSCVERSLEAAGVQHLTTEDRPSPGTVELEAPPDPHAAQTELGAAGQGDPESHRLNELLNSLEAADDFLAYANLARQLERVVDVLARAKRPGDAYRAVLSFSRHATLAGARPTRVRAEAREILGQMLRSDNLLSYVIDQACTSTGLASVQAAQILIGVGGSVVPRLLDRLTIGDADVRCQTKSILIALGDQAFPAIVDELGSGEPPRVRRAARLLGELQNPKGVEFLIAHLGLPDPFLKKEAATALVRIGTRPAIEGLFRALDGDDATAEIATAALGGASGEGVCRELARIADPGSGRTETVRREAIRSLGRLGQPSALPLLKSILERRSFFRRRRNAMLQVVAAQAIGRISGEQAVAILESNARRGSNEVRHACREALRLLSG